MICLSILVGIPTLLMMDIRSDADEIHQTPGCGGLNAGEGAIPVRCSCRSGERVGSTDTKREAPE